MVAIGIVVALFNYLYLLHVSFIVYPPKEIKRPPTWPSICNNFCSKRMPGMWVMNSNHSEWNGSSKLSSPPFGQNGIMTSPQHSFQGLCCRTGQVELEKRTNSQMHGHN